MTGKQLKARREALGLSQAALGQRFGLTVGTISTWERGIVTPSGVGMIDLAFKALEEIVLPAERAAQEAES